MKKKLIIAIFNSPFLLKYYTKLVVIEMYTKVLFKGGINSFITVLKNK